MKQLKEDKTTLTSDNKNHKPTTNATFKVKKVSGKIIIIIINDARMQYVTEWMFYDKKHINIYTILIAHKIYSNRK